MDDEWNLIEALGISCVDDALDWNVAQAGDLALQLIGNGFFASAHDRIRLDSAAAKFGDRVLCRLCLLLARWSDEWHQRDMQIENVSRADVESELADRLQERQDLDVADRSADLGDDDIGFVGGELANPMLDLIGDMGDNLHGPPEVVAAAFGSDHRRVDRTCGRVRSAGQTFIDEPLVVAKVKVGFTPVIGDENLAVFERVHGPWVDV